MFANKAQGFQSQTLCRSNDTSLAFGGSPLSRLQDDDIQLANMVDLFQEDVLLPDLPDYLNQPLFPPPPTSAQPLATPPSSGDLLQVRMDCQVAHKCVESNSLGKVGQAPLATMRCWDVLIEWDAFQSMALPHERSSCKGCYRWIIESGDSYKT